MALHRTLILCLLVLVTGVIAQPQSFMVLSGANMLTTFDAGSPGTPLASVTVTGLAPGEVLLGIDRRPATGQLYALGSSSKLYTVDPTTGAAAAVGLPFTPALDGQRFGFDFNPTVDRIRVVSDSGQNLRLHPDLGTVVAVDPPLAVAAGDVNAGATPSVTGAAYTNSVAGATTTTLYDVDVLLDVLFTQNPANAGVLNTVGPLGFNAGDVGGFDVSGMTGTAFAAITFAASPTGAAVLFEIDLATGFASFRGTLGAPGPVRGLALLPVLLAPVPPAEPIVVLTGSGLLAIVDSRVPGAVLRTVAVAGLASGESLVGIDFRPATRGLYGVSDQSRLYLIDLETGAASPVGGPFATPLSGTTFGVDFNPVVDLLRVVSDANQNLRVSPVTGALVSMDAPLAFAALDVNAGIDPNAAGAAYSNSVAGATATTLYDIDFALDVLVAQIPANAGTLQTVGSLGVDASGVIGFDVSGITGAAYAALTTNGGGVGTSELFRIDLATGAAAFAGSIGVAGTIRGLAVIPTAGASTYGTGTEGCNGPLVIGVDSEARIGNAGFSIHVANAPAGAAGVLAVSDQMAAPGTLFAGAVALVALDSPMLFLVPAVANATGNAMLALPLPADPSYAGVMGFGQWAFFDACAPGGLATSNGLAVAIQP